MSRGHRAIGIGLAIVLLSALPSWAQTIVRQPYLQQATPTSMTLVWRTSTATDSRVRYGTVQGSLGLSATAPASVTNHVVTITGLSPSTKYYYDVGSTTAVQAGGTAEHYFVTSPTPGSSPAFRAWVVGDSGTGDSNQTSVRDAMLAFTGATRPDMMLHVGDIAYTSGTEDEFTNFHFGMYKDIIRHTVQWPTLGNHEGQSTSSGQPGPSSGPYYDAFVLPAAAEAGGVASGTEAYYSFNYGNTHFISLNAYQVSRSASGPMAMWLQNDLAATTAQWVIAFWHHPPYSHGTHNSDSETELREMRENILPILEAGGVDLVLCGHSHDYERSYLIDGTYSTPTPNFGTLQATGHILDDGDGKPSGDGAYQKPAGITPHNGAVYVVAGHGGAGLGGTLNHPVMYFSEARHGSVLLDVSGSSLTLTNVRSTGVVSDTFTIVKGPQSPKVLSTSPAKSAVIGTLSSIQVTFSTGVTGVSAGDLTVNGSPATTLTGASGSSVYQFGGFPAPGNGHVSVVLAPGGIADASNPGLQFTGNSWSYTIDTTPPHVETEIPQRNKDVGVLPSITVDFSKNVTGVAAGDLRVNGQPATSLSGISGSSGPYTFSGFPAPPTGQVTVTMQGGAIQDELGQPFAGDSWVYLLRPHLVINEYLNSNNTAAQDEFGEFDDYVEIYNPANVPVDMGGQHLSDSLGFPAQYAIPAGVIIPAKGHITFWCDSQPAQGPLHTNFNLAREGEAVGLFDTDENGFAPIDSTSWTNGTTDVPRGRFPDGQTGYVNMPATPGAVNTIACTSAGECSALTDACNTGVCSANRCIAQPANEGAACDDGIACRAPDTCSAGVCDGGPSLCTGGQVCNLVSGTCETPAADPLPIAQGALWSYFKGSVAPPAGWNETAFDDSTWLTGPSGFGYGPDCSSEHGTVLPDMLNGYMSLYVRHLFTIDNPAAVQSLTAVVDFDDAFVAYVNGHEVARNNVTGNPPANTQPATADHECSSCNTPPCNGPQVVTIDLGTAQLVAGNNVFAIQAHNLTTGSSDFTLVPTLSATLGEDCNLNPLCDDGNPCTDDSCVAGLCQHAADDAATCSDGIACTNDVCSAGACISTTSCPAGRTCNLGTGTCDVTPVTVTFQQLVSGYTGTVDVGSSRVDLQACKLEYSIVSPK